MKRQLLTGLVAGALIMGACGSGDTGVSPSAGKLLGAQVDAIRSTAARTDRDTVRQRVVLLRASVEQLHAQGELSDDAAERILRSIDNVESRLTVLPTTTTTTTTTTVPPPDPKDTRGHKSRPDEHKDKSDGDGGD